MEKRLIIAIALSFVVLFAWQAIFVKQAPPPADQENRAERTEAAAPSAQDSALPVQTVPSEPPKELQEQEPVPAEREPVSGEQKRDITVDTPLYRAVWSN